MLVPPLPWEAPPPAPPAAQLAPEVRRKLVKAYGLKRGLLIACGFAIAAGAGALVLGYRLKTRPAAPAGEQPSDAMTFARVFEENRRAPLPLKIGYEWRYASGGLAEERRVIASHTGPANEPQFDVAVSGPKGSFRRRIRCTLDGPVLVEESLPTGGKRTFRPPLPLVPRTLHTDSRWAWKGQIEEEGSTVEGDLDFRVAFVDSVTTPAGTFSCLKVDITGRRGAVEVNESEWYSPGVGLVKSRAGNDEFVLQQRSKPED